MCRMTRSISAFQRMSRTGPQRRRLWSRLLCTVWRPLGILVSVWVMAKMMLLTMPSVVLRDLHGKQPQHSQNVWFWSCVPPQTGKYSVVCEFFPSFWSCSGRGPDFDSSGRGVSHISYLVDQALEEWKKELVLSLQPLAHAANARLERESGCTQIMRNLSLVCYKLPSVGITEARFIHWQSSGKTGRPVSLDDSNRVRHWFALVTYENHWIYQALKLFILMLEYLCLGHEASLSGKAYNAINNVTVANDVRCCLTITKPGGWREWRQPGSHGGRAMFALQKQGGQLSFSILSITGGLLPMPNLLAVTQAAFIIRFVLSLKYWGNTVTHI